VPGMLLSNDATAEKNCKLTKATSLLGQLHARGSRGELLGMGRRSTFPEDETRKTLPARSSEVCSETFSDGGLKYEEDSR
jgi:hypothetical protein